MPEKNKKDALLPSTMIHVDPLQQYMLRLTKEMTFAKHGVGKQMELAAFYLLVTLIEENHLAQSIIRYSFDALELADMLGINPGQGRGRYVANLFRALRREEILLKLRTRETPACLEKSAWAGCKNPLTHTFAHSGGSSKGQANRS